MVRGCGRRPEGTWITRALFAAYLALHDRGFAHSVEAWQDGELVGGVFGIGVGAFFAADSMFYRRTDGSKVALAALIDRLKSRGYALMDVQMRTEHTTTLGAVEIPREEYLLRLELRSPGLT